MKNSTYLDVLDILVKEEGEGDNKGLQSAPTGKISQAAKDQLLLMGLRVQP